MDRNDNGVIDSGRELFGDNTQLSSGGSASNGFEALADLDSNQDGKIDSQDTDFNELRLWQDKNQDGISQTDELHTLNQLGIASINTASSPQGTVQNGNVITASGQFEYTDGSTGDIGNLIFSHSDFFTDFNKIPVPDSHKGLANIQGSGQVRDLRQAAVLSDTLTTSLTAYSHAKTRAEQQAQLDGLLQDWANSSDMNSMTAHAKQQGYHVIYNFGDTFSPTVNQLERLLQTYEQTGGKGLAPENFWQQNMDSQSRATYQKWINIISVLERFTGEEYIRFVPPAQNANNVVTLSDKTNTTPTETQNIHDQTYIRINIFQQQLNLLQPVYDKLKQAVYDGLLLQTRLKPFIESINQADEGDYTALEAVIQQGIDADPVNGIIDLIEFNQSAYNTLKQSDWNGWSFLGDRLRSVTITPDIQSVLDDNHIRFLSSGEQDLNGSSATEKLIGNQQDNIITANGGNDILSGGGMVMIR